VNAVTLYLVPLAIVAVSALLMAWHVRQWRAEQAGDEEAVEGPYHRRRYRRRMQSSAMLLVSGVAIYAGQLIHSHEHPTLYVFFWSGVALLVFWVMALALADVVATRLQITRLKRQRIIEEARLKAELAQARGSKGNGKAPPRDGS
jgi:hypothetical protein